MRNMVGPASSFKITQLKPTSGKRKTQTTALKPSFFEMKSARGGEYL
jgi:hypothetical protein